MQLSKNRLGILALVVGIAVFSVQDLILKLVSCDYPLHQAMMLRSVVAIPFLLVITQAFDGTLDTLWRPTWPFMLARGFLNFVAYTAYYLALAALPMATTVALYFTAPLMIVIFAVLFLKERVSADRWLALIAGFLGVLLMVRPGSMMFDWAMLLPILCGAAYAGSMILARVMGIKESAAAMAFWGNASFLIAALVLSLIFGWNEATTGHPSITFLTRGWVWPTHWDGFLMALCGPISAVGITLLTAAYRMGQSATIAPFEFSFAFWGLLFGWLFFSDLPDFLGWIGIAVIIGAGIYVLASEPEQTQAPEKAVE
jgi:drug/metabolite transporter (DMT)-like permease